jgi:ABC-2 type transport system permease protein
MQDPDSDPALAEKLPKEFGFRPIVMSLTDAKPFWFYMTLGDGHDTEEVPLPDDLTQAAFKNALESAAKRLAPGFLKTVAVMSPSEAEAGPMGGAGRTFSMLRQTLSESARWLDTDLKSGQVPPDADLLMVLDPVNLDTKQVFAIDQFLMQGGTVLLAAAPTDVTVQQSIVARPVKSGLEDWLADYGLSYGKGLVLDQQSGALPIPVERNVGGYSVRELVLAKYPYIVDVRGRGLDAKSPITSSLGQIDVPWAAPLKVDLQHAGGRKTTTLLQSSSLSWVSESSDLMPDYQAYPDEGFAISKPAGAQTLALMAEGEFDSMFKGKPSPLLTPAKAAAPPSAAAKTGSDEKPSFDRVIQHSPVSSRLVLLGSSAMLSDQAIRLVSEALGTQYGQPTTFVQNLVDWSLEDQGLLSIRGREHFARTLTPLTREAESFWEYFNYAVVLGGLGLIWWLNRRRRKMATRRHLMLLGQV